MPEPETKEHALIRKMRALYARTHQPDCADKFRAIAEWWRLNAQMSATPETLISYSENMDRIAADMERRVRHHEIKPPDYTRFQWSRVGRTAEKASGQPA